MNMVLICIIVLSYSLYKIMHFIDSKTAIIIFKSFILSRLEYGGLVCIGAITSVLNKLQKLVNRHRSSSCPVLRYSHPKSESYKKSVVFQGPSRWEKLPSNLKLSGSFDEFKCEIKKYYLEMFLLEGVI